MRLRGVLFAFVIAAAAAAAGCGGGGGGGGSVTPPNSQPTPTAVPTASPTAAASASVPVGTSSQSATVAAGGITAAVTVPAASSGTATVTIAASATLPSGAAPLARHRSSVTQASCASTFANLALSIAASSTITLSGIPALTITLPSNVSTSGVAFYIGYLAPGATAWQEPLLGPASVSGQTLTFSTASIPLTLTAGQTYQFALYTQPTNCGPGPVVGLPIYGPQGVSISGSILGSANSSGLSGVISGAAGGTAFAGTITGAISGTALSGTITGSGITGGTFTGSVSTGGAFAADGSFTAGGTGPISFALWGSTSPGSQLWFMSGKGTLGSVDTSDLNAGGFAVDSSGNLIAAGSGQEIGTAQNGSIYCVRIGLMTGTFSGTTFSAAGTQQFVIDNSPTPGCSLPSIAASGTANAAYPNATTITESSAGPNGDSCFVAQINNMPAPCVTASPASSSSPSSSPSPSPSASSSASPAPTPTPDAHSVFWVPNSGANTLTFYGSAASGNSTPAATLSGSSTQLSDPLGLAVDALENNLYVVNGTGGPAATGSITVYPFTANGNVAPTAVIEGSSALSNSTALSLPAAIALDPHNNIYVANLVSNAITIYAAGSNGDVAPMATLKGSNTQLGYPTGIAAVPCAAGDFYVANSGTATVTFYNIPNPSGTLNVAPTRTIAGSNTGLFDPWAVVADGNGNVYVANAGANTILEFGPGANGNVAPIKTISSSQIASPNGITLDSQFPSEIIVGDAGGVTPPNVLVFGTAVSGSVAPLFSITGTGLSPGGGLAAPVQNCP